MNTYLQFQKGAFFPIGKDQSINILNVTNYSKLVFCKNLRNTKTLWDDLTTNNSNKT